MAISRAQVTCFVICAKTLFESKCNTIEQCILSTFSALEHTPLEITLNQGSGVMIL